ncbi:MAG TPA: glycosyltransferase family 1 protein [Myxococcota bacterium]|nr:glycosyltransferase family 1 protein [Myxococcota bacterium]
MKVLIDGTMARGGGGFTYLVNILPRIAAFAPEAHFRVLVRSERVAAAIQPAPNLEVELLPPAGVFGRLRFTAREAARRARAWGADLYFSAGESAALGAHCPTIASFRNPNVFTDLDQGWSWRDRTRLQLLRAVARISALACDRIMFVSEDSASWIGDAIDLPAEKRAVVYHGIDRDAWSSASREPVYPWSYILSVSSIYRYKNFVKLIEAYAALAERRPDVPDLVIIGDDQDHEYARKMEAARAATGSLSGHIHVLGEVRYADMPAWYAGADLFVFPSHLETFGHPLLEAMASDVPVVAADIPVFREIAGDAAVYADPHDAGSLAGAMESVLFSLSREMLLKRGRERVREFSWDRTARRLLELFRDVVETSAAQGRSVTTHGRRSFVGLEPMPSGPGHHARASLR